MWKLKQIFDGEYGCEERQPGEKEKCLVILANEEGEEKTFEANEDWIEMCIRDRGDIQDKFLSLKIRDKMIDKTTMGNALRLFRSCLLYTSRCV